MEQKGVIYDGFPSYDEIKSKNGWASEERFAKGPVAVIECVQPIPCNPCESACQFGAIKINEPITNIPELDRDKCTGCGICVAACSGLAIFIVDKSIGDGKATVSFPFEYLPLPQKGDIVKAASRSGEAVCDATVVRVLNTKKNDHTPVVTIEIPVEQADNVRSMIRIGHEEKKDNFRVATPNTGIPDDMIVCRCEEVTAGEVRKAIREYGGTSVSEVKRRARCGMGLCQGKTCGKLVTRLIAEETGKTPVEIPPATDRPPVRPVTFGELMGGGEDE